MDDSARSDPEWEYSRPPTGSRVHLGWKGPSTVDDQRARYCVARLRCEPIKIQIAIVREEKVSPIRASRAT